MAMSCDYRIMATGKYTIGLNETLLVSDAALVLLCVCASVCMHYMSPMSVIEMLLSHLWFSPFENTATTVVPLITALNGKAYAMLSTEI